ncbi:MAG: D-alanyl-D-alanine carboxypeptidase family protein [Eubacteriaceae bacterium]
MGKKVGLLLLLCVIFLGSTVLGEELPEFSEKEGVIIAETNSNNILFKQRESDKFYPASTTKLLTALVAVENGNLGDKITVGSEIDLISSNSSVAGLVKDEVITLNELLYGLLLPSGNDAANTIAVNLGRKIAGNNNLDIEAAMNVFAKAMNDKAKTLEMNDSKFVNPSGLHDEEHYTTPGDLLKLGEAAFKNDVIREISKTKTHNLKITKAVKVETGNKNSTTVETNEEEPTEHNWVNSNLLLFPTYDEMGKEAVETTGMTGKNPVYNVYATSGKTGFTEEAEKCFVFEAQGNGKDLVGVILGGGENQIFEDANQLINTVILDYDFITWTKDNNLYEEVTVENYKIFDGKTLGLRTEKPLKTLAPKEKKDQYSTKTKWDDTIISETNEGLVLKSNINESEILGEVQVYEGSNLVSSEPLLAVNSIGVRGWSDYLIIYWYITLLGVIILLAFLRILYVHLRRKNQEKLRKEQQRRARMKKTNTRPQTQRKTTTTKRK